MKNTIKKSLFLTIILLPAAALSGTFLGLYQLEIISQENLAMMIENFGSKNTIILVIALQTVIYALICGFFGFVLSEKLRLLKPFSFKKKTFLKVLAITAVMGIVFSLDYWTFGAAYEDIRGATEATLSTFGFISSALYGGIIEEVMLRLFLMSLIAFLIWKIFFRKCEKVPNGVLITANIVSAMIFAAGHLPATIQLFGVLSPLLIIRCFLLNGSFGIVFGYMYRRYGIQYAMICHMGCHIVSKMIWIIFI